MSGSWAASAEELGGLTGWVIDVVDSLGEVGIGVLTLAENIFPPIPSEVILPLGGYLAQRGRLDPMAVMIAATLGALVGAWILYAAGARLGEERASALLTRVPLVDREDVDRAFAWFERHGRWAVLIGRLMPGVRSLISLPAGSARMPLLQFTALTLLGSLVWNGALVAAGMALGTQWKLVQEYSSILDHIMIAAVVGVIALLIVRRVRNVRAVSPGGPLRTCAAPTPCSPPSTRFRS